MVGVPQIVGLVQFAAGLGALGFLIPALRNRDVRGRRGYSLFTIGIAIWMVALAVPKFTTNLFVAQGSFHFLVLGVELAAAGWLILALEITDHTSHLRRIASLLGAGILLAQVALWTNPVHSVMYEIPAEAVQTWRAIGDSTFITYGNGFWAHAAASYLCGIVAEGILVFEGARSSGLRRKQFLWLSVAAVPVLTASIISTWGLLELPYNVTSFGFLLAVPILAAVLFKTRFLDIVPVARRTVMAGMDDAMITIDQKNRVVDANRRALALFEPGPEYVGMEPARFFESVPEGVVSAFDAPDGEDVEVELDVDGETRHFSISVSPVSETVDRGRIVIFHDITTQKRREAELNRQNRRLDEFASVVSHDLRNPLHVAEGYVEMAQETGDLEHLETVVESHDRMKTMIDELLTMAKAETVVDDGEEIALGPLIEDAWDTTQTEGGSLRNRIDEATVHGNPDLLGHVFENLFRNAIDHNVPPVTVTVGLLPEGDGFYVADDGKGVPPEARTEIFERGHTTSDTGTGLGLAIVEDLVRAHGWSIDLTESEAGGARFEVSGVDVMS